MYICVFQFVQLASQSFVMAIGTEHQHDVGFKTKEQLVSENISEKETKPFGV